MKQFLTVLIGFTLILSSCSQREKLPANIAEAVTKVNNSVDSVVTFEDKFKTMSDSDIVVYAIKQLDVDGIVIPDKKLVEEVAMNRLIIREKMLTTNFITTKVDLDNLLKLNPKFSDYDEVKNIKKANIKMSTTVESRYQKYRPVQMDFNK